MISTWQPKCLSRYRPWLSFKKFPSWLFSIFPPSHLWNSHYCYLIFHCRLVLYIMASCQWDHMMYTLWCTRLLYCAQHLWELSIFFHVSVICSFVLLISLLTAMEASVFLLSWWALWTFLVVGYMSKATVNFTSIFCERVNIFIYIG